MNPINPALANFVDVFAGELQTQLSDGNWGKTTVSVEGEGGDQPSDLIWWSWSLSIDPASRILLGAPLESWRSLAGLSDEALPEDVRVECLARFTPSVEQTARHQFGSEVTCLELDPSEAPEPEWTSVSLLIEGEAGSAASLQFRVNPDLESALGVPFEGSVPENETVQPAPAGTNSAEILMQVEMPVNISLGRTKMRMKDLLHLTNGSVVELDQELGDEVEIRVNNFVIAYGEVVAAEGNYAVRVLRMAPARNTADLRGALPERAA